MQANITLRGMTWSDPRGYDPLVAAVTAFQKKRPDVSIQWDKRSLQEFESTPVQDLAANYDLLVIDHPHVGTIVKQNCLIPMGDIVEDDVLLDLASQSVGRSFESYHYQGHQWALPLDAAAQVQAYRPDRLDTPVRSWTDVVTLAEDGKVIWPLRPPHVLMAFFTLMGNIGAPCGVQSGNFAETRSAHQVLNAMQALYDAVDPTCSLMDPIAALDALADSPKLALSPLTYLYKGYANIGYRPNRIAFSDIPVLGKSGPLGSALGGTGIAVSANTAHPKLCGAFSQWVAGGHIQSTLYAQSNGQPGHAAAWNDASVNEPVGDAYFKTRMTHEAAWLRPRHDGYMGFQEEGSEIFADILAGKATKASGLSALKLRFDSSFNPFDRDAT
ncbi:extracellular solute-binding protein [Roseibium algae]|uniref:Extracellular solute-binding protein n=1 Tax=Roseibium algae TaxID=3123038 RepID=A0ABU8TPP7_9HYPH